MLTMRPVDADNVWALLKLKVSEKQKSFVATNIESIVEAYTTLAAGGTALPFGLYDGEKPVGFVMIGKGTVGNENESELIRNNYSLWRLMIDKRFQGQGLGWQTLDAAVSLIRSFPFGKAEKVWLSYEPENTRAKEMYRKYGFVENGEMCGNEVIAVYTL